MPETIYDIAIIGSGPAGLVAHSISMLAWVGQFYRWTKSSRRSFVVLCRAF